MSWLSQWLKKLLKPARPVPPKPHVPTPILPIPRPSPVVPSVPQPEIHNAVASLINAERSQRGLPPYQRHDGLDALAQAWANDPQVTTSNPHGDFGTRFTYAFPHARGGEIIARRFDTPGDAVYAWMNEDGIVKPHRDGILGAFTHMGVGVANHNGQRYYVVDFAAF